MATFTSDPPWTPVKCDDPKCRGGANGNPWRGPLGKCHKDYSDIARCPHCLTEVVKLQGDQR
jgi:hypothetical protein